MDRDGGEFREVFDRLLPAAQQVALRITGDRAVAEELAAEALTRLFIRWPMMRHRPYVDPWVLRVTTNLAIGEVRKRNRTGPPVRETGHADDAVVLRMALSEALARLPRRQREVVILRFLSDTSEADVARLLRISPGSVKTHAHRGLASLRELLGARTDEEVEVRLASK
jgi:RNA polymerase sigma factor (sigma-70 family)